MSEARVIEIFVASPGDLPDERDAVTEVARKVTQILASISVHFTVNVWEDHPSGFGRPQGQINELLDRSEIFVGLLHRKWGSPTGTHTSGFHEEFERARDRRRASGSAPELGLFFKTVPDPQRDDPGEELKKVLAFRQEVIDGREVLFESFDNTDVFRSRLLAFLVKYVMTTTDRAGTETASRAPDGAGEAPPIEATGAKNRNDGDALATLERVADRLREDDSVEAIEALDAARMQLTAAAALGRRTEAIVGVHETNILYKARTAVSPSLGEVLALVDAAAEHQGAAPAWYWVKRAGEDSDEHFAVRMLILTVVRGATELARRRGYEILTRIGERQPDALLAAVKSFSRLLPAIAENTDAVSREDQATLLSTIAVDDELWQTLAPILEELEGKVGRRLIVNLLRTRPEAALGLLPQVERISRELVTAAIDASETLDLASVRALLGEKSGAVRGLALRLLDEKAALTDSEARGFLSDPQYEVSNAATDVMLRHGWSINRDEWKKITETAKSEVLRREERPTRSVRYHEQLPVGELEAQLNWYMPWTADAYEALGRLGVSGFADRVRRDLQDRFATFQAESRAYVEASFREHAAQLLETESWGREMFTTTALGVLGLHDSSEQDVATAAVFLTDEEPDIVIEAMRALGRLDASDLIDQIASAGDGAVAQRRWDEQLLRDFVDIVFDLTDDPVRGTGLLLKGSVDDVLVLTMDRMNGQAGAEADARELLGSEATGPREAAARYIASVLDPTVLESELEGYLARGRYFYNVVCVWDAALYGSNGIRAAYRLPPGKESGEAR